MSSIPSLWLNQRQRRRAMATLDAQLHAALVAASGSAGQREAEEWLGTRRTWGFHQGSWGLCGFQ